LVPGGAPRYLRDPPFSRREPVISPRRPSSPRRRERRRARGDTRSKPESIGRYTRRPSVVTTTATRRRSWPLNRPKWDSEFERSQQRQIERCSGSLAASPDSATTSTSPNRTPPRRLKGWPPAWPPDLARKRNGRRTVRRSYPCVVMEARDGSRMMPTSDVPRAVPSRSFPPTDPCAKAHGHGRQDRDGSGEARQVRLHDIYTSLRRSRRRPGGRAVSSLRPRSLALRLRLATDLPWTVLRRRTLIALELNAKTSRAKYE
jgi:hypothetical protein